MEKHAAILKKKGLEAGRGFWSPVAKRHLKSFYLVCLFLSFSKTNQPTPPTHTEMETWTAPVLGSLMVLTPFPHPFLLVASNHSLIVSASLAAYFYQWCTEIIFDEQQWYIVKQIRSCLGVSFAPPFPVILWKIKSCQCTCLHSSFLRTRLIADSEVITCVFKWDYLIICGIRGDKEVSLMT